MVVWQTYFYQNRTRALSFFVGHLLSHLREWRFERSDNSKRLLFWPHWIRVSGRNNSSGDAAGSEWGQYHNHKQFRTNTNFELNFNDFVCFLPILRRQKRIFQHFFFTSIVQSNCYFIFSRKEFMVEHVPKDIVV